MCSQRGQSAASQQCLLRAIAFAGHRFLQARALSVFAACLSPWPGDAMGIAQPGYHLGGSGRPLLCCSVQPQQEAQNGGIENLSMH